MKMIIIITTTKILVLSRVFWLETLKYLFIKVLNVLNINILSYIYISLVIATILLIILSVVLFYLFCKKITKKIPKPKSYDNHLIAALEPSTIFCLGLMDKHLEVYERAVNDLKILVEAYNARLDIYLSEIPISMYYHEGWYPIRARTYCTEFLGQLREVNSEGYYGNYKVHVLDTWNLEPIRLTVERMLEKYLILGSLHEHIIQTSPILREIYNKEGVWEAVQERFITLNELWVIPNISIIFI